MTTPSLNATIQADIKKLVKLSTFVPAQKYWLDTGSPELNAALGSSKYGIPFGKIIELRGINHGGKTTISLALAGMAQKAGAGIGYIDIEQSRDREWAEKFGLRWRDVVRIYPKLITRKNKPPRLETGEELFAEAEAAMSKMHEMGFKKQFWLLDSVAMIRTKKGIVGSKKEEKAGVLLREASMNISMDRAKFLSDKLPEWCGLAANYNATIILINQLRKKMGVVYGNPDTSPGGDSMQHACAVRASVRRISHGRLRNGSHVVGIVGLVENFKNKSGRGCVQDQKCAFVIRFDKSPAIVKFVDREAGEKLMKDGK